MTDVALSNNPPRKLPVSLQRENFLCDVSALAYDLAPFMPSRSGPAASMLPYDTGVSERGRFLQTRHRRLYLTTPELVDFLDDLQFAMERRVRGFKKERAWLAKSNWLHRGNR